MKTLFLEAKYTGKISPENIKVVSLPKNIGLITTVQFADHINEIKTFLEKQNKKVFLEKGKQKYPGQILGCDISAAKTKADAFLYIGTGKFHPLIVAVKTNKPVFTFNPITNEFKKINETEINNYKKRKKAALVKFLSADTVGILISTKKGQYYDPKKLSFLEKKYPKKKFYIFITETIDYNQLENFPFIEAWINTACARIEEDISICNVHDLE